eukprot:6200095-Pleurochrysis_carterae.AAC.4
MQDAASPAMSGDGMCSTLYGIGRNLLARALQIDDDFDFKFNQNYHLVPTIWSRPSLRRKEARTLIESSKYAFIIIQNK